MRLSMLAAFCLGITMMIGGAVAAYRSVATVRTEVPSSAGPLESRDMNTRRVADANPGQRAPAASRDWFGADSLTALRETRTQAPVDPSPQNFAPGGLYHIDTLAFTGKGVRGTYNAEAIVDSAGTLELVGWAIDTVRKNSGQSVQLVFASQEEMKIIPTEREERVDLVNVYNQEGYRQSGFIARTTVEDFKPGEYKIYVRVNCLGHAGCQQHDTGRKLTILPAPKNDEEF